jgi:hypothetical protein
MAHLETFKSYIKAQNKAPLSFGEGLGVRSPQSCHVDKGDIFSRQLFKENQDTSVVGMTAPKDSVTCVELD